MPRRWPRRGGDAALFEALRQRRSELAKEQRVAAYVVFADKTLIDMARRKPATAAEMSAVHGVGEAKLRQYGAVFLDVIRAACGGKPPIAGKARANRPLTGFRLLHRIARYVSKTHDFAGRRVGCSPGSPRKSKSRLNPKGLLPAVRAGCGSCGKIPIPRSCSTGTRRDGRREA